MTTETTPTQAAPPLETYAIVELMGHVRMAGRLTEESHFGVALGRLDVPMPDGSFTTQFFGGGSVYRITPCSEEIAREIARASTSEPVSRWDVRHLLPQPQPVARYAQAAAAQAADDDEAPDDDSDEDEESEKDEGLSLSRRLQEGNPF